MLAIEGFVVLDIHTEILVVPQVADKSVAHGLPAGGHCDEACPWPSGCSRTFRGQIWGWYRIYSLFKQILKVGMNTGIGKADMRLPPSVIGCFQ